MSNPVPAAISCSLLVACATPTPTPITDGQANIQSIVATANDVYWADFGFDLHDVMVARVMHAHGDAVDVLADDQGCPIAVATDQVSVFWARCDGAVVSASAGVTTVIAPPGGFAANTIRAIVATTDTLYLAIDGTPGKIVALPKQANATITTVVDNLGDPSALAVDDANLYFVAGGALYERARQADVTTPPTGIPGANVAIGAIASDGNHLYWGDSASAVHAMTISDGSTFELSASGSPAAFAFDASHLYWIANFARVIERAPLTGGGTETLANITDPSGYAAATIAVTTDSVIWADNPSDCDTTIEDCYPTTIESVAK